MSELVPDIGSVVGREPNRVTVQYPAGDQTVTTEKGLEGRGVAFSTAKRREKLRRAGPPVSQGPGHKPFDPRKRR